MRQLLTMTSHRSGRLNLGTLRPSMGSLEERLGSCHDAINVGDRIVELLLIVPVVFAFVGWSLAVEISRRRFKS